MCDDLCDNIEELLDVLNLEYRFNQKMITMSCPIHNGDNASAVNIYPSGERYRGNWVCRTHSCEKIFKPSIIGFIRGILSNRNLHWEKSGDKFCSFIEAVKWCENFLKKDYSSIKIDHLDKEKKTFANMIHYISNNKLNDTTIPRITRKQIINTIKIPANYYIDRSYSEEILCKYDVGLCTNPDKAMHNRVVVPIYDNDYKYMVGCTGRSIFEKCNRCSSYHDNTMSCPTEDKRYMFSKWKHSQDFKSQNHLYNFWFAKKFILQSQTAIVVESPGNVWRLEENGIHNSIGIFGSSLSDRQKILLDSSGAMSLVLLTDNDEAGKKAAEQIKAKCQNTYRIFMPQISKNDVGEMSKDEIQTEIKDYIKRVV